MRQHFFAGLVTALLFGAAQAEATKKINILQQKRSKTNTP
jgi:hypothetical protein